MKIITKPMSSPSRTEQPPPPQMLKFLRTNTVTRSRGRSRSSSMFIRNNKKNSSIDTQQSEPSSPKVTCIGQVRSSKPNSGSISDDQRTKSPARFPCSCSWVNRNALFCTRLAKRLRPRSVRAGWGTCQWFSSFGNCRSSQKSRAGSPKIESNRNNEYKDEDECRVGSSSIEGFICCSPPPRNALLLTRCRSAPYKSSSLASRFWGQEIGDEGKEVEGLGGGEGPTLEREEPSCRGPGMGRVMEELGEFEGSIINGGIKIMETGEGGGGGGIGKGWVLTRCKSEPARSGEGLIKTAPCL